MKRITKVALVVYHKPRDTRKDANNTLALALPDEATFISGPILAVSNLNAGVWGPIDDSNRWPNIFHYPLNRVREASDNLRLFGCFINNRDENLDRVVEATFIWDDNGLDIPDRAETSVMNKTSNLTNGEDVSIAFSVPSAAPQIPVVATYQAGSALAPFISSHPPYLHPSHHLNIGLPPNYVPMGDFLKVLNTDPVAGGAVRITSHTNVEA
jgi:hypothetical protein